MRGLPITFLLRTGRPSTTLHPDEMSRQRNRGRPTAAPPSAFDQARDELFQHIMRCGVIGSDPEHMREWFDETTAYFAGRYHELSKKEITDLRVLGERFAAPTKRQEPGAAPAAELPTDAAERSGDAAEMSSDSDDETAGSATAAELDTVSAA